jgi:hypothetical protein
MWSLIVLRLDISHNQKIWSLSFGKKNKSFKLKLNFWHKSHIYILFLKNK